MKKEQAEAKTKNKSAIYLFIFFVGVLVLIWQFWPYFWPSEEELCDDALDEAEYFLAESNYDLSEWMTYEYNLKDEQPTTYSITNTDCYVEDRNNIEITFNLDVKTSKNRIAHVEALVTVTDGYADYVEFNQDY